MCSDLVDTSVFMEHHNLNETRQAKYDVSIYTKTLNLHETLFYIECLNPNRTFRFTWNISVYTERLNPNRTFRFTWNISVYTERLNPNRTFSFTWNITARMEGFSLYECLSLHGTS